MQPEMHDPETQDDHNLHDTAEDPPVQAEAIVSDVEGAGGTMESSHSPHSKEDNYSASEDAPIPSETNTETKIHEAEALIEADEDGVEYTVIETTTAPAQTIEDLTLAEALGQFFRAPRTTSQAVLGVAGTQTTLSSPGAVALTSPVGSDATARPNLRDDILSYFRAGPRETDTPFLMGYSTLMFIVGFAVAVIGCIALVSGDTRAESRELAQGGFWLAIGALIWLHAEVILSWDNIKQQWQHLAQRGNKRDESLNNSPTDTDSSESITDAVNTPVITNYPSQATTSALHPVRIFAAVGVTVFGLFTWLGTGGNQFTALGFWAWMAATVAVVVLVAPDDWSPTELWPRFQAWRKNYRLELNWVLGAMLLIILLGASFRLTDLSGIPPDMTSDHIEKILDANRVREGDRDIFFVNNGGREPFQMYAMALISYLPGLGINFDTLKLLAVIEGLITLPALFWMGRVVIGEEDKRLGTLVGLALAALVAVSYWHVSVTRLSLRIVLTPLVGALLTIFLIRGMRYNRRGDFIIAGLVLGFGLYTYQAVRMMPLVVLAAVGLAMLAHIRNIKRLRDYVLNLTVLVLVSFIAFLPLFHFSLDFPEQYWRRTAGRLLGDDVIQVTDEQGNIFERTATLEERLNAFSDNIPILTDNIRNAFLMFNWKGDVAWINGVPNHPAMDPFTGGLFIVGAMAWLALIVRRRDPALVLIPIMLFIMLLPSALSIAAPLENPSATRSSGALPPAYLMAALPLALIVLNLQRISNGVTVRAIATAIVLIVVLGANSVNRDVYFNDYLESYNISWKDHRTPGRILEGFANSDGAYGNAYLLHSIHWLDHRIVGLEGGIIDWQGGIADLSGLTPVQRVPDVLNDAWFCENVNHRLDPNRDLLFFYNRSDEDAFAGLTQLFPDGRAMLITAPNVRNEFWIYRVPAFGTERMRSWLQSNIISPLCPVLPAVG